MKKFKGYSYKSLERYSRVFERYKEYQLLLDSSSDSPYLYRGHSSSTFALLPSALRKNQGLRYYNGAANQNQNTMTIPKHKVAYFPTGKKQLPIMEL